jgi:cephalosporin-C deacetylase-like acetyl esterase
MLSRRRFLQTPAAGLALSLAKTQALAQAEPAKATSALPPAAAKRDYWNDWPLYLTAKVKEARARRKAALAALANRAQTEARIQTVRAKVWDLIGGPLEKTPLNPRTVGTIERKSYRIEKVVFESQPSVYVTAHLYVPTAGEPPFAGILAPLGHAPNGKAYRSYQYAYQSLARKGYVVLAFDPFGQGERHQYLDSRTGRPRYGPTGEHTQAGRPLLLLGATFAQYRVWDGIRALDYLLSRPEVDPQRIGCTGQSGGGTMTMYLCALEPRIQVAVEVEGNSENLAGPDYEPPGAVADAEQNLVGGLAVGIDRGDLLAAFGPKPLLVCYTPQDGGTTYSPVYEEGTREIFEELREVYKLLGAEEKVSLFASFLPHDLDFFIRRAAYDWFNRWLGRRDAGTEEVEFDESSDAALNCTSTGEVLTSLGGRSVVQLITDRARAVIPPSPFQDPSVDMDGAREHIRAKLRSLLALPTERTPLRPAILSSGLRRGLSIEEFELQPEAQVRLPGWFIRPSGERRALPTILHVSDRGKDDIVRESNTVESLVRQGYALCAINLRGVGNSAPRYPSAGPLFYRWEHLDDGYAWASLTLGRPVLGQRVWDLLRCLDYLETRPDVDHAQVHLVGTSSAGLAALLGASLDDRPRSILLERTISDFSSLVESEEYSLPLSWFVFGFLRAFDLPDLVAGLVPRRCWLLNAAGPRGDVLPESEVRARFKLALNIYYRRAAEAQLRFLVQPDYEWSAVASEWLRGIGRPG